MLIFFFFVFMVVWWVKDFYMLCVEMDEMRKKYRKSVMVVIWWLELIHERSFDYIRKKILLKGMFHFFLLIVGVRSYIDCFVFHFLFLMVFVVVRRGLANDNSLGIFLLTFLNTCFLLCFSVSQLQVPIRPSCIFLCLFQGERIMSSI